MCDTSEFPPDKHAVAITTTICVPDVTEETIECMSKSSLQYSNSKTDKDKKNLIISNIQIILQFQQISLCYGCTIACIQENSST